MRFKNTYATHVTYKKTPFSVAACSTAPSLSFSPKYTCPQKAIGGLKEPSETNFVLF